MSVRAVRREVVVPIPRPSFSLPGRSAVENALDEMVFDERDWLVGGRMEAEGERRSGMGWIEMDEALAALAARIGAP